MSVETSIIQLKRDINLKEILKGISSIPTISKNLKKESEFYNIKTMLIPKSKDLSTMDVYEIWKNIILVNKTSEILNDKDNNTSITIQTNKYKYKGSECKIISNMLEINDGYSSTLKFFKDMNYKEFAKIRTVIEKYERIQSYGYNVDIQVLDTNYGLYLHIIASGDDTLKSIINIIDLITDIKSYLYDNKYLFVSQNKHEIISYGDIGSLEINIIKDILKRTEIKEKHHLSV